MPSTDLAPHLFAFITSNSYSEYHRRREIEALTSKIEASGGSVTIFEKPKFIFSWLFEKIRKFNQSEISQSKPLITFGSVQYLVNYPLLYKFLIALPIQIQISLRQKKGLQPIALIYKPDQAAYLNKKLRFIYIQYDNYAKDRNYFMAQTPNFARTNLKVINHSLVSMFSSRALLQELPLTNAQHKCYHYPNAIDRKWIELNDPSHSISNQNVVIGFVGQLDCSFDTLLVEKIALRYPNYTIRIIGANAGVEGFSSLKKLPNIEFSGKIPYSQLPKILKGFSIGICPYKQDDFSKYRNPLKIYEYFSAGFPIVTMPCDLTEEVKELLYYAYTHEQFLSLLDTALNDMDDKKKANRIQYAALNCWDNRAEYLLNKVKTHLLA